MSDLNKLLDKIKETRSLASDNSLAAALGVKRQTVSNWRHGHNHPDAVACATIAGLTGEPLARVLGIVGEARAISREEKSVLRKLAASAALLVVMVGGSPLPARSSDGPQAAAPAAHARYYANTRSGLFWAVLILYWLKWRFSRTKPSPSNIEAFAA